MTLARISLCYLWTRRLSTTLNVTLLAFAVAAVTLLLLTGTQLEERIARDARGVDLVVGAHGSETQLILSSVHGLDTPTAEIPWRDAQTIAAHRAVRTAIPLAFADRYFGFRIAATTHGYPAHYGARLREGRLWEKPMEAVFGADVAARLRPQLGSEFEAVHMVPGGAGEPHREARYRVVGIFGRTGSVLDGLIVTGVESHWTLHPASEQPQASDLAAEPPPADRRTVNALLIRYDVSHAATEVPYVVRQLGGLQAASPVDESARLHGIVAAAIDLLRVFAAVLLVSAVLSMLIALYNGLKERRYDIAVMRTLGATRERIMVLLLFEGVLLALGGALLGLAIGHGLTSLLGVALAQAQQISVSGMRWHEGELWIVLASVAIGVLTALVPAWRAHEMDIAGTLARG